MPTTMRPLRSAKALAVLALLTFSAMPTSGCIILKTRKAGVSKSECRPDQYWDGTMCRHKGKGKGARKHDG